MFHRQTETRPSPSQAEGLVTTPGWGYHEITEASRIGRAIISRQAAGEAYVMVYRELERARQELARFQRVLEHPSGLGDEAAIVRAAALAPQRARKIEDLLGPVASPRSSLTRLRRPALRSWKRSAPFNGSCMARGRRLRSTAVPWTSTMPTSVTSS